MVDADSQLVVQDLELLDAWRRGDRKAGDELVSRHFESVCRFFRAKLGDDVQDLIQRTFLDCVQHRDAIATSFRAYLFTVARHRLYDQLRHRHRAPVFEPLTHSLEEIGPTPSSIVGQSQELELLQRALQRLPLEQQITLELYYWEDLRGAEIAAVFGVSEHTVRSRLARARAALRGQIEVLANTPELARSTMEDIAGWARRMGELALADS